MTLFDRAFRCHRHFPSSVIVLSFVCDGNKARDCAESACVSDYWFAVVLLSRCCEHQFNKVVPRLLRRRGGLYFNGRQSVC